MGWRNPPIAGSELQRRLPHGRLQGHHVVVLAEQKEGYASLAATISRGQLAGEKGAPRFHLDALAEGAGAGGWVVLTGCRKGLVPATLVHEGPTAAARQLQRLVH